MALEDITLDCVHDTAQSDVDLPTDAVLQTAASMLNAAGDASRLRLLLRLAQGRRCVSELAEAEGEKLATVSARLKLLHSARLVSRQREAKHVYYELADDHISCLVRDLLNHAAEDTPQR
ncbi:MAG: metalloregulator ArsR/SmtB family transcription factor [Pseudomonadota bacterium]